MNNRSNITILEASLLTGKSQNTIYKYIERGTLPCEKNLFHGKECLTVKKTDIERIFNLICHDKETEDNESKEYSKPADTVENIVKEEHLTAEKVREVMEEFFSTKQAELVKPVEQQSLYRLGRVEQENQFLKEKLETLLEENQILQKELKSLPVLSKSMENLEIVREENLKLQEENQTLQDKLKSSPGQSIEKVLMDNASNLKILSRDKTELQEKIREKEEIIKTQNVRFLQEKEDALEEQKVMLMAIMEEEKKQLLESWTKERQEKKNYWWKFW
jgi:hypothetical protein